MSTNKYWLMWTGSNVPSSITNETITWSTVTKTTASLNPPTLTLVTGSTSQFSPGTWYAVEDTHISASAHDGNYYEMYAYVTNQPSVFNQLVVNPSLSGNEYQVLYCAGTGSHSESVAANSFFAADQSSSNALALDYITSILVCTSSVIPGLLWELPLTDTVGSFDFGCGQMYVGHAVLASAVSASLPGDPSVLYTVTCKLRGVSEYGNYIDGEFQGPFENDGYETPYLFQYFGGITSSYVNPTFELTISNPPQQYYLNPAPPTGSAPFCLCYLNRTFTFSAYGSSTIILIGSNGDGEEIFNDTGVDHAPYIWTDSPPMQVTQPYLGQFMQLDILTITS